MLTDDFGAVEMMLPELLSCFDDGATHGRIELIMPIGADGQTVRTAAVMATVPGETLSCVIAAIREWRFLPGVLRRYAYGVEVDADGIRLGGISW
jgi:hypothetical protein